MNFPLEYLEKHVDEASFAQGEALYDAGEVHDLFELEKNLWLATSAGFEVEVQLSPSRVIAGTCDCEIYQERQMCGHITAVLLTLRQKQQAKAQKRKKAKRPATPRKLTTGIILDQVDPEELIGFVRNYARTNRNFAIALKARFASSVSNLDSKDKYLQLLDTTISAVRKPDRHITVRGVQRLSKVIRELDQQILQAVEDGNFVEAVNIAQSIIEKISPVLSKATTQKADLRQQLIGIFERLFYLIQQSPAPGLLRRLWDDSRSEYNKLTYRTNGLDLYFFKLMFRVAREPAQQEDLLKILEEQSEKYASDAHPAPDYLLLRIAVLERLERAAEAQHLMEQNLNAPDVLSYAIQQAQERGNRPREKALAQTGLRLDLPDTYQQQLEALLLRIAEEEGEAEQIRHYALRRFFQTLDLDAYQKARRATPAAERSELLSATLARLKEQPYSANTRDAIAQLLELENAWPVLMAYVEEVQSLDLLEAASSNLMPRYPERVRQVYTQLLQAYAQHYVGQKTARRISQALDHLIELGAEGFARAVASELRQSHPERHTLMAELQRFAE